MILKENILAEMERFPSSTNILEIDFDRQSQYAVRQGIRQNTTVALFDQNGQKVDQKYDPDVAWIKDFFAKNPLN